jgi:hypothetical protein
MRYASVQLCHNNHNHTNTIFHNDNDSCRDTSEHQLNCFRITDIADFINFVGDHYHYHHHHHRDF